jgi:hypothetical protein
LAALRLTVTVACQTSARAHFSRPRPARHLSLDGPVPVGALFFWGRRADAPVLPRYFFVLAYPDKELRDPGGAIFSGDEAAIEAARKVIDELLAERQP